MRAPIQVRQGEVGRGQRHEPVGQALGAVPEEPHPMLGTRDDGLVEEAGEPAQVDPGLVPPPRDEAVFPRRLGNTQALQAHPLGGELPAADPDQVLGRDHRVMDGAMGARFLQDLKRLLEQPLRLIL
ncbi:MAG: 2-oxo acid dehydrogenase subunit E2 [Candidatus Rokubacteria bacterium]|nr:2-oxo acid dehydrogenase subunit E2 [Candidatus Rokubacteria bacterium]